VSNKTIKKSKKTTESVPEIAAEFFAVLLDGMINIYMFLIIAVMPFYFQEGFSHIGSDKASFFQNVGRLEVMFTLPVLLLLTVFRILERKQKKEKWQVKLSIPDRFALLYGIALILSYLFSDYKQDCLWGAKGWYMGLLPQLMLLYTYLLISRYWQKKDWMFYLFFPVSAVVFGLGILNRFGIFPIDMKVENVQFISTIGNINWYCGYLVTVLFAGCYLFVMKRWEKTWQKCLMGGYLLIGYASLMTQGSASGLVALAVACLTLFCIVVKDGERMLAFWQEMGILSGASVILWIIQNVFHGELTYVDESTELLSNGMVSLVATIICGLAIFLVWKSSKVGRYPVQFFRAVAWVICVFFGCGILLFAGLIVRNTLIPGSIGRFSQNPIFTFTETWGSNRGATWTAGVQCFREQNLLHKVFGVGPDGMSAYLYGAGSESIQTLVTKVFGTATLTNAHCEWLTILLDVGVVGAIGFVGMMVATIIRNLRYSEDITGICGACGLSLLAYSVNNFFSFQQSMGVATMFLLLGIGAMYCRK